MNDKQAARILVLVALAPFLLIGSGAAFTALSFYLEWNGLFWVGLTAAGIGLVLGIVLLILARADSP